MYIKFVVFFFARDGKRRARNKTESRTLKRTFSGITWQDSGGGVKTCGGVYIPPYK